jgi:hypothetical protein
MRASKPGAFARLLVDRAGTTHDIWLVWSGDYRSVEAKCQRLNEDLVNLRAGSSVVVENDAAKYFEHAALAHFPAPG